MSQKKAILFLGSQMETGGAQKNLLTQAQWFSQQGYRVVVVFLYDKEGLHTAWQNSCSFPIINLKARRWEAGKLENLWRLMGGVLRAFRVMKSEPFDAIETFTHHSNLIGIPLAWLAGIPVRVASHRGRFKGFTSWQERIHAWMVNSRLTSCLVVVSEPTRLLAVEEGVHDEKIIVVPNGVAVVEKDEALRNSVRAELNIEEEDLLVLSVGRLRYEKGHTYLVQAAPLVLQENPKIVVVIAGDGTLRQSLEEEARNLGVNERVRFLGTRSDAVRLMGGADIFVLPSRSEGMPNALLEAMGAGVSVIASDVGGVGEIIKHGENGLLVPSQDHEALAEAVLSLAGDENERKKLAEAGQLHISREFSLELMCKRFAAILDNTFQKVNGNE